ncbi:MAG: GGDEF domain-containing protein [Rhodospirillales bacterium]
MRERLRSSHFPVYAGALAFVGVLVLGAYLLLDKRAGEHLATAELAHVVGHQARAVDAISRAAMQIGFDVSTGNTSDLAESQAQLADSAQAIVEDQNKIDRILGSSASDTVSDTLDRAYGEGSASVRAQLLRIADSARWLAEQDVTKETLQEDRFVALIGPRTQSLAISIHNIGDSTLAKMNAQTARMKNMLTILHGGIIVGLFAVGAFVFYPFFRHLQDQRQHLLGQARTDPLTGAFNRRSFDSAARAEFSRARRHGGTLSVMALDIDNFKKLNDTFGHATGDDVIRTLAAICQDRLRESDIFARTGGEEFSILLPSTTSEEAMIAAEKLRDMLANTQIPVRQSDTPVRFTVSFGVAAYEDGDDSIEDLLHRADMRLYEAKRLGRNRVVVARTDDITIRSENAAERPKSAQSGSELN